MPMPRYIGIGISIAEVPQKESLLADVSRPLFADYEFCGVLRSKGRCLCFTVPAPHCFIEGRTLGLTPPGDISICPFVHSELFSFYQCYRFETCQINSDVPLDQPGQLSKSIGSTKLFHCHIVTYIASYSKMDYFFSGLSFQLS